MKISLYVLDKRFSGYMILLEEILFIYGWKNEGGFGWLMWLRNSIRIQRGKNRNTYLDIDKSAVECHHDCDHAEVLENNFYKITK